MAVTYSVQEAHARPAEVIDKAAKELHRVYIKDGDRVIAEIVPGENVEGESLEDRRQRRIGRGEIIPAERNDNRAFAAEWSRKIRSGEIETRPGNGLKRFLRGRG